MGVNSLEESVLVFLGFELEKCRDSDVSAPAFGLLESLVATRHNADAFQFPVNHKSEFLVKMLL